ncbi:glycosyltransferase [Persicimonas caeni]|uniref:Glycosyltransferase n=1 Tax=Persicimonas caeni TaxID=2292766 RepID=A0A4Y6PRP1_PERCE|nr:glycosyltransferase [Persicimonas caeni]QDG50900.1 glycosyltransferase [Persicimonas caeni]QED32121.1 glycosyltransferase [Persicimonas caeni]
MVLQVLIASTVLFAAASLVLTLLVHLAVHIKASRKPPESDRPMPISVLKPLKGVDDELWENLVALAEQDHPEFEIVLGAADPLDPALTVARRFQRAYPGVDIRVHVCDQTLGLNPKVSNLAVLSQYATYEQILISDSNVRPGPSYLRDIAAELAQEGVGLVSNVLVGVGERSTGALFENLHLNSFVASVICAADLVGHPCVIGKSMLFRKRHLEELGGWHAVADILAEDYVLGNWFHKAGHKVALSSHVLPTVNVDWTFERFSNRHVRWAQLRRRINPPAFFAEPLLYPVPFVAAAVALGAAAGTLTPVLAAAALGTVVLKVLSDDLLNRRLRGDSIGWRGMLVAPIKDLVVFLLWSVAAVKRVVIWRGNKFIIDEGSRVRPLHEEPALEPLGFDEVA